MRNNKSIAILGGGPMGLAFAYELKKLGYDISIFEADDRLGGMTSVFEFGDLKIERFYHFHTTSDTDYFQYLKELGIYDKLVWRNTKMSFFINGKLFPWGSVFSLLKFPYINFLDKFRYIFHIFYSTNLANWKQLDKIDAISWLKKWLGPKSYSLFWSSLLDYKFYELKDNLSAAWIQSRIKRVAKSRDIFLKEKLSYLDGSSQLFLDAIEKNLINSNVRIYKSSPVKQVLVNNNTVKHIQLFDGRKFNFDQVISTIPTPFVSNIFHGLPTNYYKTIKSIQNVGVVCLIYKIEGKFSDSFWLNINDSKMDIPGVIEYSNLNPLKHGILYIPYYMPITNMLFNKKDEFFIKRTNNFLKSINPNFSDQKVLDVKVNRYKYAQPVCEKNFKNMLPNFKVDNIDNLFIGDTSFYYPEDRGISESIKFAKKMVKLHF